MVKLYYGSLSVLLMILMSSCNLLDFLKDEPDKEKNETIVTEITEDNFQESVSAMESRLNALVGTDAQSVSEVVPCVESIEKEEWVESVEVEDEAVFIKVKGGGYIALAESSFKDDEGVEGTRSLQSVSFSADKIVENIKHQINNYSSMVSVSPRHVKASEFIEANNLRKEPAGVVGNIGNNDDSVSFAERKNAPNKVSSDQRLLEGCKNRKVLIADVTAGEFPAMAEMDKSIQKIFENWYGVFDVDTISGSEVSIHFLQNHLTDYGLIFFIAHGSLSEKRKRNFICVGGSLSSEYDSDLIEKWKNGENIMIRPLWGNSEEKEFVWGVGPDFFEHLNGSFDENSIMVGFICNALTYEDNMWKYLQPKGLGAFIGYEGLSTVRWADEAFNSIVRLLINPANAEIMNAGYSLELSLKEAFLQFDRSPHIWTDSIGNIYKSKMLLNTNKDNIALFSTICDEEEVNLGYPSLFASRNLGASAIQNWGGVFDIFRGDDFLIDGCVSGSSYDHATWLLGSEWSIPTAIDFGCLLQSYTTYDFLYKGILGTRFTGTSGESIFIPDNFLQCGDHAVAEPYDFQKDTWFLQEDTSYFMYKLHNETTDSDEWEIVEIENGYFYDFMVSEVHKRVSIYSGLYRYDPTLQSSIRPVKRNEHPLYKDVWKQIDATADRHLRKVKLITLDDMESAAKYHYPDYKVVVI